MRLGAGGYTIEGSPDPVVRLAWETRDPTDARRVRAEIRTDGNEATIETSGPHNGFTVVIRIPQRSDLWVKLTAGDLKVGSVEGHKHVTALAGDLDDRASAAARSTGRWTPRSWPATSTPARSVDGRAACSDRFGGMGAAPTISACA